MLMMVRSRKMLALLCLAGMPAAHALSALGDGAMSDTFGGDGFTITTSAINSANTSFVLQDTDGFGPNAFASTVGDINFRGIGIATGAVSITVDAGSVSAGSSPILDVNVQSPSLTLSLGGVASAALGFNVLADICPNTNGGTQCAFGSAGDYPVLTTPGAANASLTLTSLNLNLQFSAAPAQGHMGVLTDGGAFSVSISGSNPVNMALVDPGAVGTTPTTAVGGLGFKSISVTGIDLGSGGGNYTALDLCPASGGSVSCQNVNALGITTPEGIVVKGGVLMGFNGTAMNNVTVSTTNVTLGNVGTGVAGNPASQAMGSMTWQNVSLAGAQVMISGH